MPSGTLVASLIGLIALAARAGRGGRLHLERQAAVLVLVRGLRRVPRVEPGVGERLEVLDVEDGDVLAEHVDDAAVLRVDVDLPLLAAEQVVLVGVIGVAPHEVAELVLIRLVHVRASSRWCENEVKSTRSLVPESVPMNAVVRTEAVRTGRLVEREERRLELAGDARERLAALVVAVVDAREADARALPSRRSAP